MTTVVPLPGLPVAPVLPSLPVAPVLPVLPVFPVAPVGPAGPGTATGTVGVTTTAGLSQALKASAPSKAKTGSEWFMGILCELKNRSRWHWANVD